MPHQCVTCGTLYEDGSKEILTGCSKCKSKMFFFIRKEAFEKRKAEQEKLASFTIEEKKQIENDVYDLLGDDIDRTKPVILDIESVNILEPGKYELDLVNLFKKKQPVIYKLEDGKYMVDLIETFKRRR